MTIPSTNTKLLVTEDWTKIYQSLKNAEFQSYDFETIRRVLISYVQSSGTNAINVLLSQSITVDGAGTSYSATPSVTIAGNWYPLTLTQTASNVKRLPSGNYLLTATLYVDSTVESGMFFDSTSGLDVDAIPGEISTRIIMDSSKSQILAQAINVSAKGVK